MTETRYSSLSIKGYAGKPVPNRLLQPSGKASELAVMFPGLNYTCDMPLLYYTARLFLQRGLDVLQLWRDYTASDFQAATRQEQLEWLSADAWALLETGSKGQDYQRIIFVGKSIGTLALAYMLPNAKAQEISTIWLTPLLYQPHLVEAALQGKNPALFIAGTGDRAFDAHALERIQATTHARAFIAQDADHSMEIPGDVYRSLQVLKEILQTIADFLGWGSPS